MLQNEEMLNLLSDYAQGKIAAEILRRYDQSNSNKIVIRLNTADEYSIIVKMWNKKDWKGRVRRVLRQDSITKERKGLELCGKHGIKVPEVLGQIRFCIKNLIYTDALFIEDLGECITAGKYIEKLIDENRDSDLEQFENQIIDLTKTLVDSGILDTDHSLINMVVDSMEVLYKLDLEIARKSVFNKLSYRTYGKMIGMLVASYTFAVQPRLSKSPKFAENLSRSLNPSNKVLQVAKKRVESCLQRQFEQKGIDSRFDLPW